MKYKTLFSRFLPAALLFATLYAVSGCEREETLQDDGLTTAIVFNPMLDGQQVEVTTSQTRVADIDLKTFGFTVCGYQSVKGKFEEKKSSTLPNVFAGKTGGAFQVVKYEQDRKRFVTYERPWVVADEDYLSFFAWSDNGPSAKKGITGNSSATTAGYPTVNISVCDAIVDQPDIVVAQAVDLHNNALISAVDLQFKHILSKISFKGYSSSSTSIAIKEFNIKYGGTMKSKATYKFDPSASSSTGYPFEYTSGSEHKAGTYYPISASAYPSISTNNNTPATSVFLGNMMQIPQETRDGFITAQVKYSIEGTDGVPGPVQTREITIKEMRLDAGHHYILAFDFVADKIQVSVNSVADWNEMTSARLPLVAGPRGDVMLWLDAGDKPYSFNGEDYWLDRSGYNRHCKIVNSGTAITRNATTKTFVFNNYKKTPKSYIELPALGTFSEATLQLLLKTTPASNSYSFQTTFFYSDRNTSGTYSQASDRQLFVHIFEKLASTPPAGRIDFDCYVGGLTTNFIDKHSQLDIERMGVDGFTEEQQNTFALYTFRRKPGYKSIARNDNFEKSVTAESTRLSPFVMNNGYLGPDFEGEVKMLKITRKSIPTEQIESDYAYLKKLHQLPDDKIVPLGTMPTKVPSGLIAYFDANDAPIESKNGYTGVTSYRWQDRSGYGNHLEISGYQNGITYDETNKFYVFSGTNKDAYMRITKSLGALKEYWVEFGVISEGAGNTQSTPGTTKRVLIHFSKDDRTTSADNGFIWYFPNENNNLWAYNNGVLCIFDNAPFSKTMHAWGIGRSSTEFRVDSDGKYSPVVPLSGYAPRLDYCYIGIDAAKTMPFKGKIKTIRIYNRYVSTSEIQTMATEVQNGIENKME